ncbi:MAG: hypothetical protein UZ12_BCD005000095 [Bacteroidetes bacterium OLB12]|nr:MAG: hypothetical protein UZ12_BCD005000095 [Bacteroidetes bacterium OLB12]
MGLFIKILIFELAFNWLYYSTLSGDVLYGTDIKLNSTLPG